jgi:GT2 family glycosyltransferase
MTRSDFAAFIITFNRQEILQHTIHRIASQTVTPSKILIVNNGEPLSQSITSNIGGMDVEVHTMGFNSGPAGAAHFAMSKLVAERFQWIQWIDDDNPPKVDNLNERLFNHLKELKALNVGIIAPMGSYFNTTAGVAVRVSDKEIIDHRYLHVQTVGGNQCMLINSKVVLAGCLPTPLLFFGFEETNFCLKVLNAGYQIIAPCDLFFEYRNLASRWDMNKSDLRKIKVLSWRSYYSIRNLIYMFLYEFKKPATAFRVIIRATLKAIYGLKQPSKGFSELYYISLAVKDGLLKKLGMRVKPIPKHQK